jgi:hypothetical protein
VIGDNDAAGTPDQGSENGVSPSRTSCPRGVTVRVSFVALAVVVAACAPRWFAIPGGTGTPVADFRTPFGQASSGCRGVRTLTAEMHLSGRAGAQRMRGTVLAGFERPGSLRLEGVAPFGPPAFILVARSDTATLLLPRDDRVLTGVSAADVLEALVGLRVDPDTLRAILTGCVANDPDPRAARSFPTGWLAVDVGDAATVYLRQDHGAYRIVAGRIGGLDVRYGRFEGGMPRDVGLQSASAFAGDRGHSPQHVALDLALTLSQVTTNTPIKPAAFQVDVPRDAVPLTLDELRRAGPLGEK